MVGNNNLSVQKIYSQRAQQVHNVTTVPVTTIDALVLEHRITSIPYLKVDVDGYDPLVLFGAAQSLHLVDIIQYEVHLLWTSYRGVPWGCHVNLGTTCAFLETHGFQSYLVGTKHALRISGEYYDPQYENRLWSNAIAVRQGHPILDTMNLLC